MLRENIDFSEIKYRHEFEIFFNHLQFKCHFHVSFTQKLQEKIKYL